MPISSALLDLFCGAAIVIGIFGTIIPNIPGLLLSWAGVLVWALFTDAGPAKWWVLGLVSILALFATVLKYLLPGRQLARSGVPTRTIVVGTLLAIVGFFAVPVVGLFLVSCSASSSPNRRDCAAPARRGRPPGRRSKRSACPS